MFNIKNSISRCSIILINSWISCRVLADSYGNESGDRCAGAVVGNSSSKLGTYYTSSRTSHGKLAIGLWLLWYRYIVECLVHQKTLFIVK